MTHYRSVLRRNLRLALSLDAHFAGVEVISAWSQNVDADSLPVAGVATPTETKDQDALDSASRTTTVIVVLKRRGGSDIEETLDIDSVHVERVALAALRTLGFGADLDSTDIAIDGASEQLIGTLTMTFRADHHTPEPLTI